MEKFCTFCLFLIMGIQLSQKFLQGESFVIENNIVRSNTKAAPDFNGAVGKIFLDVFDQDPDHVAQIAVDSGRQTKFSEMKNDSVRLALWLRKQNITSGDIVSLCADNRLDNYILLLASIYEGVIFNPWEHNIKISRARELMVFVRPKLMFCIENDYEVLLGAARAENISTKFVVFGNNSELPSLGEVLISQAEDEVLSFTPRVIKNPTDCALIQFSSGTTGTPKGIMHSYDSYLKNFFVPDDFPVKNSKIMWYTTPVWISSTLLALRGILYSSTRIFHEKFEPYETSRVIDEFSVNWLFLTPLQLTYFGKSDFVVRGTSNFTLGSLKEVWTGGGSVSDAIIIQMNKSYPLVPVLHCYELSEAGGFVAVQKVEKSSLGSVGFVLPWVDLKILQKKTNSILNLGQVGEIFIKKPVVSLGYYKQAKMFNKVLDHEGWLRTKDTGYIAEDGEIFVLDRKQTLLKNKNTTISLTEIENELIAHPDVLVAAAVSVPFGDSKKAMIFVVPSTHSEVNEENLPVGQFTELLGKFEGLIGGVKYVKELPTTPSGKVDRKLLESIAREYAHVNITTSNALNSL